MSNLDRQYRAQGITAFLRSETDLFREAQRSAYLSPVMIAMNDVWLCDNGAFTELEEAYEERSGWLLELGVDPVWDPSRSDPRFQSLLQRVKAGPPN